MRCLPSILAEPDKTSVVSRLALTIPFWGNALSVITALYQDVSQTGFYGTQSLGFYLHVMIGAQLFGSALIIVNRGAWLGISALTGSLVTAISIERAGFDALDILLPLYAVLLQIVALGALLSLAVVQETRVQEKPHDSQTPESDQGDHKPLNWRFG